MRSHLASSAFLVRCSQKVCKVIETTGGRFKGRQCQSQAEWDAIDRAHKAKMHEIDSQPIRAESEGSGFAYPDVSQAASGS